MTYINFRVCMFIRIGNDFYSRSQSFGLPFRNIYSSFYKEDPPPQSIFRIFLAEAACCPWLSFLLSNTPVSRHTTVLKKERPCSPASLAAKCGPVIKLRLMRSKQKDQRVASGNLTWDLGDMWPLPLFHYFTPPDARKQMQRWPRTWGHTIRKAAQRTV